MEKSLDEEDDVNDMENAVQFRTLMKEKGYCFFFQDLLRETPLVALLSSQNNYPVVVRLRLYATIIAVSELVVSVGFGDSRKLEGQQSNGLGRYIFVYRC